MFERSIPVCLLASLVELGCVSSEGLKLDLTGRAGAGAGSSGGAGNHPPTAMGGTTGAAVTTGLAGAAGGMAGSSGAAGAMAGSSGAAGGSGTGGAGGGTGRPEATFTKIYNTIVTTNCAGTACHVSFPYAGGYNFSTKARAFRSWNDNVFPGFGEESPMFQVLNLGIMPKDRPSLSVEDLFLVLDWINAGALNN